MYFYAFRVEERNEDVVFFNVLIIPPVSNQLYYCNIIIVFLLVVDFVVGRCLVPEVESSDPFVSHGHSFTV